MTDVLVQNHQQPADKYPLGQENGAEAINFGAEKNAKLFDIQFKNYECTLKQGDKQLRLTVDPEFGVILGEEGDQE